ncbi:MAG: hypothetical protein AMJ79_00160 [Phycisphaerae bacterium SM23_30]|nr:MAG: hypothetical protein AMJ79_00160 [Phycisphaerae bacterium SM23_30]
MKIALAQINPVVGDIDCNRDKIIDYIRRTAELDAEIAIFSEMSLLGYPPMDLLLNPQLIDDNIAALNETADACTHCAALVGFACRHTGPVGRELHNAAALLNQGQIRAVYYKQLLPDYDVFDENRYFEPAGEQEPLDFHDKRLAVTICEDIWARPQNAPKPYYKVDPLARMMQDHPDLIVNLSAIPFAHDKQKFRFDLFAQQARNHRLPLINVNQVGGNDELIFDGSSCAYDAHGNLIAQAKAFDEDLLIIDLNNLSDARREPVPGGIASVHDALVLGLRDYVRKCRFDGVLLGLSGGIDSAVLATLAVAALGPDKVHAVALPGRFSRPDSLIDAQKLARQLGINLRTIPIEKPHALMEEILQPHFADRQPDVTEENLQARIRGNILMALSNKFGHLLLAAGNKSELAAGYCTLYGDMTGGLAPLADVPKTMVYELARYVNRHTGIIPSSIITKPPSAELKPDQTDQDTLPPYDQLDQILERYVVESRPFAEIVAAGFDKELVARVIKMTDRSEFKRRQAPPALKISRRAFGLGRRLPLAQNYQPYKRF